MNIFPGVTLAYFLGNEANSLVGFILHYPFYSCQFFFLPFLLTHPHSLPLRTLEYVTTKHLSVSKHPFVSYRGMYVSKVPERHFHDQGPSCPITVEIIWVNGAAHTIYRPYIFVRDLCRRFGSILRERTYKSSGFQCAWGRRQTSPIRAVNLTSSFISAKRRLGIFDTSG